ncbi:hypothetical protein VPNG_10184 [Cytospora leucostoma]|uniref:Uncharacterized protein n=1 Tax=Cytospora leucostoma TaxID=1230097 RepID=A0A423VFT4_9PEZI|nr:hypothetical protein VPNG_10184 [Cytospora leucostoma]
MPGPDNNPANNTNTDTADSDIYDVSITTLPPRVRKLAERVQSRLGLWPWQLLSVPSVQRPDLNPTSWSVHTIEALSALVTRETAEAERADRADRADRARTSTAATTANRSTRRSSRLNTKTTETNQDTAVNTDADAAAAAAADSVARRVVHRVASQLAQAVDDRVRKQTRLSRDGDTILSTPKRPCLTCQDIRKILGRGGGRGGGGGGGGKEISNKNNSNDNNEGQDLDQDQHEGDEGTRASRKLPQRQKHPRGRAVSEELGEDLPGVQDLDDLEDNIDPMLRSSKTDAHDHGRYSSPSHYRPLMIHGHDSHVPDADGGKNNNGNEDNNDDCDDGALVLTDPTVPDSFVDDQERTAAMTLTTTSRQQVQRLRDTVTELHDKLDHLRASLAVEASDDTAKEDPRHKAANRVAQIQRDLDSAEAKLRGRYTAEESLASAMQAMAAATAGSYHGNNNNNRSYDTSTTILQQMQTALESYRYETQQIYAAPIASLRVTLAKAREEAEAMEEAHLRIEQDIEEVTQGIQVFEERRRLWVTYENVLRIGPDNLGRLLGRFPGLEGILREACRELDLRLKGTDPP